MTYVVQSGDTMYTVAGKFGVPLAALITANPRIKDPNVIYPGQVLNIPVARGPSPPPGWCTLSLTPLRPEVHPGSALVNPGMPHIMVATMSMPDPSGWTGCGVYTAWVMDEAWTMDGGGGMVVAWFDLLPVNGTGFWINHTSPKMLGMREHICVTAEDPGHPVRPGSRMMLHGSLGQCCRRDP
ncbi:MAG: LysM domain-containing protein [Peptococcaceae bacterium]|jgi:spore coat assembly protein SafA|nr:LysM domain-containing protein [Peptococcaceae bacterium]